MSDVSCALTLEIRNKPSRIRFLLHHHYEELQCLERPHSYGHTFYQQENDLPLKEV